MLRAVLPGRSALSFRHSCRLPTRVVADRALCTGPQFEGSESEKTVRVVLKTMAVSWLAYKGYTLLSGGDTMFLDSSLNLVRSKYPDYHKVGVSRLDRWHHSDTALAQIVGNGGVALLIKRLESPDLPTRLLSLKILVNLAPVGRARGELVAGNAVAAAESSCAGFPAEADVARCRELAQALREAAAV